MNSFALVWWLRGRMWGGDAAARVANALLYDMRAGCLVYDPYTKHPFLTFAYHIHTAHKPTDDTYFGLKQLYQEWKERYARG